MNEQIIRGQNQVKAVMNSEWMRPFIGFVIGVGVIAGAWYGYKAYTFRKNAVAQRVFSEVFDEYERAMSGVDEAWSNLETVSALAYEQHEHSLFGPYILALNAEALSHRGEHEQALEMINQVVEKTHNSPLHLYYQTKSAIMKLDSQDTAIQESGLNGLRAIAQDKNNPDQDRARYYLGAYYRAHGEDQAARDTWNALANESTKSTGDLLSVWSDFASSQLQNNS